MKITKKKARRVGNRLKIDWKKIPFSEFYAGMNVELEHGSKLGKKTNVTGNSPIKTGRIALAHLEEDPKYYTKLAKMEKGDGKKSLQEAIILIVESIIDEEFDIEELKRLSKKGRGKKSSITPFQPKSKDAFQQMNVVGILSYAESELEYINKGNARQVFGMPDGKSVLKIAYQSDRVKESDLGIKQNEKEVEISERESDNPLLARVLDWDEYGYKWIISERVTPIDPNSDAFSEATGIPEDVFYELIGVYEKHRSEPDMNSEKLFKLFIEDKLTEMREKKTFEEKRPINAMIMEVETYSENANMVDTFDYLIDFINRNNLLAADIARIEHWGFDDSGQLKLYDYGAEAVLA